MNLITVKASSICSPLSCTLLCLVVTEANLFAVNNLRLIALDPDNLAYAKAKIIAKDETYIKVFRHLCAEADEALHKGPYSVVYKIKVPPSGDLHDYMSIGPYWWPDTTRPDSLPYIRRDGEVNPERHLYDNVALDKLDSAVTTLSLAYYFSGNGSICRTYGPAHPDLVLKRGNPYESKPEIWAGDQGDCGRARDRYY